MQGGRKVKGSGQSQTFMRQSCHVKHICHTEELSCDACLCMIDGVGSFADVPRVPVEVVDVRPQTLASKGEVNGVLAILQGQGLQLGRAGHKCPAAAGRRPPLLGSHQLTHHAGCLRRQSRFQSL